MKVEEAKLALEKKEAELMRVKGELERLKALIEAQGLETERAQDSFLELTNEKQQQKQRELIKTLEGARAESEWRLRKTGVRISEIQNELAQARQVLQQAENERQQRFIEFVREENEKDSQALLESLPLLLQKAKDLDIELSVCLGQLQLEWATLELRRDEGQTQIAELLRNASALISQNREQLHLTPLDRPGGIGMQNLIIQPSLIAHPGLEDSPRFCRSHARFHENERIAMLKDEFLQIEKKNGR